MATSWSDASTAQTGLHQPGFTHLALSSEEARLINTHRNLERYLDLVGLTGEERQRVSGMAPGAVYEVEIGWYVARKRGGLVP